MTVLYHFVADDKTSTACFVHGFEAVSMTVMHHFVADGATEWWSGQEIGWCSSAAALLLRQAS